jgi:hypothetical protein
MSQSSRAEGEGGRYIKNISQNLKGQEGSADLGLDGRKILKRILKKYGVRVQSGFIQLRVGTSGLP